MGSLVICNKINSRTTHTQIHTHTPARARTHVCTRKHRSAHTRACAHPGASCPDPADTQMYKLALPSKMRLSSYPRGKLLLLHNQSWHPVSHGTFNQHAANAACKHMGFMRAKYTLASAYGEQIINRYNYDTLKDTLDTIWTQLWT